MATKFTTKPKKVSVKLAKQHTHRGIVHPKGATIEVYDHHLPLLKQHKVIEQGA